MEYLRINPNVIQANLDIITNSSSQIFTIATKSTLDNIKNLVNSLLALGGTVLEFDDLFTFEWDWDQYVVDYKRDYWGDNDWLEDYFGGYDSDCTDEENEAAAKEAFLNDHFGSGHRWNSGAYDDYSHRQVYVKIVARHDIDGVVKAVALLNNLSSFFEYEEHSC